MGILASVYTTRPDLRKSSSYVLGQAQRVVVVNARGPATPSENAPAVRLVTRMVGPGNPTASPESAPRIVHAVPEDLNGQTMFGDAFIASSDSRFRGAIEEALGIPFYGAVALHDLAWRGSFLAS